MAEADITQTNSLNQFSATPEPPRKKMTWKKWAIIGGVAAGAAVGIILGTRGGGSSTTSSSNPTITILPGPVTIGGH